MSVSVVIINGYRVTLNKTQKFVQSAKALTGTNHELERLRKTSEIVKFRGQVDAYFCLQSSDSVLFLTDLRHLFSNCITTFLRHSLKNASAMIIDFNKSEEELLNDIQKAEESERKKKRFRLKGTTALVLGIALFSIIPLGILSVIVYTIYDSYQSYELHNQLENNNVEIEAFLRNEYTEVTKRGSKTYRVNYLFKVDGQYYEGTSELSTKPTSSAHILIVYDPQNPGNNKAKGGKDDYEYSTQPFIAAAGGILILGIGFQVIRYLISRHRG